MAQSVGLPEGFVLEKNTPTALPSGFVLEKAQPNMPAPGDDNVDEVIRQLGITGDLFAQGIAATADIPRLVSNPVYAIGGKIAKNLGYNEAAQKMFAQVNEPTYMEKTAKVIDEATGGYLRPRNNLEKGVRVGGGFLTAMMGPEIVAKGAQATANAVKSAGSGITNVYQGWKAPSTDELFAMGKSKVSDAGELFNDVRAQGAEFTKPTMGRVVQKVESAAANPEFIPSMNRKTLGIIEDMKDAARSGQLNLNQLHQFRTALSRIKGSEDGISAGSVINEIDRFLSGLGEANFSKGGPEAVKLLQEAMPAYSQAKRYETIANIVAKGEGDASKIQSGLKAFMLRNKNNPKGYSEGELDIIRAASRATTPEKLIGFLGRLGISKSNILTAPLGAAGAFAIGGQPGVAAAVGLGSAAKEVQDLAALGKAMKALNAIEGGAPAASASMQIPQAVRSAASAGAAASTLLPSTGGQNVSPPNSPSNGTIPPVTPERTPPNIPLFNKKQEASVSPIEQVKQVATQAGVSPQLAAALAMTESSGKHTNPKTGEVVKSPVGAIGLMQLMPNTAEGLGVDPYNHDQNIQGGVTYLKQMLDKYNGNETLAMMAYNWGPDNVDRWMKTGKNPDKVPSETINYIRKVKGRMKTI